MLVNGSKSLAKAIVGFHLIPNDISERWLISIENLPIATLLVVVKRKAGFVSP
jgi:hypothetical protein